jgi:hypothetical protein
MTTHRTFLLAAAVAAAAVASSFGGVASRPAQAGLACATMPTLEGCIACGSRYDPEVQRQYCASHWKPHQKLRAWTDADERRTNGGQKPRQGGWGINGNNFYAPMSGR